ncbi:MAG TPA: hypothetical protein VGM03_07455 [Phycisphaerae bacterium]|jgi:hypothetical protein
MSWWKVNIALQTGQRGLPGSSCLSRLLTERRGVRRRPRKPTFAHQQILAWADAHHRRTGEWPKPYSGSIPDAPGESWRRVCAALSYGLRGLTGGSSLAQLLAKHRGVRRPWSYPRLTSRQILAWADAHQQRTGQWPKYNSGPVHDATGESWGAINGALHGGHRGLPRGSTLERFLAKHRGFRTQRDLRRLSIRRILAWADAHHRRTGDWPHTHSGAIREAPGETWARIYAALHRGSRGLAGGDSLPKLLRRYRGVRSPTTAPRLTKKQILVWADAHFARTQCWPSAASGPVHAAPGEDWGNINRALRLGHRGLPRGSSLVKLLAQERGRRAYRPALTEAQIFAWAQAHQQRAGRWPTAASGPIVDVRGENWRNVDSALRAGMRSLPGGSSLAKLLTGNAARPALTEDQIVAWADAHRQRTGRWPTPSSGRIPEIPRANWSAVNAALRLGLRGLPGGDSLRQILRRFGRRPQPPAKDTRLPRPR